jgi:hypothetical protein
MNDARPVSMPKARKDRLIIKELPDETLVYDQETDRAHCLNDTATIVWKNCDGRNSIAEITESLQNHAGAVADESIVWLALEQLEKFKLLEAPSNRFNGISRRKVIRSLGVAAVATPIVASIIVPLSVDAQSMISPTGCAGSNPSSCPALPCTGGGTCQKITGNCICA